MNQLTRVSQCVTDVTNWGLLYAIAPYRIDTSFPLDSPQDSDHQGELTGLNPSNRHGKISFLKYFKLIK